MNFEGVLYETLCYNELKVFLFVLITMFIITYINNLCSGKKYNLPPGPIGLPFVGYLPFLGTRPQETLSKLSKSYGNIISFNCGEYLTVVCNDWASAEEALSKTETLDRPPHLFAVLTNGLGHAGANGREWNETRNFSMRAIKEFGIVPQWTYHLQEEIADIVKVIEDSQSQVVDVRQIFLTTFTRNVMAMLFGKMFLPGHELITSIAGCVDYVVDNIASFSIGNFLPKLSSILVWINFCGSKRVLNKIQEFEKFVMNIIDRNTGNSTEEPNIVEVFDKEVGKQNINPYSYYSKKSLYGNMQALILGGTETTRTGIIWLLLAVAKYPEVQDAIHKELDQVLDKEDVVDYSDRDKLPYTYCTILESLRWKTIVPINALRITNADCKIGAYDVPKNTVVAINFWAIHNDSKYWPEPHIFKPERFLDKDGRIMHTVNSFSPFSIGRRNCPGRKIALVELFLYFSAIMHKFKVLPPDDGIKYDTVMGISYQAKNLKLRFVPRK